MNRLCLTVCVFGLILNVAGTAANGWQVVYQTDFSSDPGWTTDQPANYYWNQPAGSYFLHNTNTYPGYYPNRYAGVSLDDPIGSFELQWDINVARCDWSAGLYFGLWDSSLQEPSQAGEFIMAVIGRSDGGRVITLTVGANGIGAEAGTAWQTNPWSLNKWYTFKISYDSDTKVANLGVFDRDTAQQIWSNTLAVPGAGFTKDLQFLGSNLGMVGRHGYSGINPSAVFNANLDNVVLSVPEPATLQVVWQADPDGSGVVTNNNSISRVKLTPDKNNVMVFHYNGGAYGIPTRVDKLDASTGDFVWPLPGYKTVTKPGERISLNGWVDGSGNLFIMGSWSGNTIWKYDSELATQLCSYTGGSGFEYVMDAINDELNNLYVAGMTGSGSNQGSRLVKLGNNCNQIWTCLSKNTSAKDCYGLGIALDSSKNVFRVGMDYSIGGASDRGRLIGHSASNGAEFLNYTVSETNSSISGITIDSDDSIYIAYCYAHTTSGQERTVVQKLERAGSTANVVWEYRFDDIGMYLGRDAIVKHTGNSFYVAFDLRQGGTTVPGIAEFDLDGNLLWKDTIDRPGWNLSSIDAKDNYIYVGLTNAADGSQTQVLCLAALEEWSFVQISDTHIGWTERKCEPVPGAFPPRYRCRLVDARENLAAAIYKVMKEAKPAFIVNTGDVADYGCWRWPIPGTPDKCTTGFYRSYSETIKQWATDEGVQVYSIPGNHDQRLGPAVIRPCDNFPSCFSDPCDNPLNWFMLGRSTFLSDDGQILFVVLDTGSGNCSGVLTGEDIDFLNGLEKDVPKIILTHHPAVADDDEISRIQDLWGHIWDPCCFHAHIVDGNTAFMAYCEDPSNNVYAVLSGHTHVNHVYNASLGVPADYEYPQYIQTGTVGKGDVRAGDYLSFRKIDVIDGEVKINDVTQVTKEDWYDYIAAKVYSPGKLHVYDSNGQHTGYEPINGFERDISGSFYFSHYEVEDENGIRVLPEEVLIFDPCDDYLYEVVGTEKGTYRLEIVFGQDGNNIIFEANEIPTVEGAVHQYVVDWDALSKGLAGVTVFIDREGDGDFEKTVVCDSVLTSDEFDTPSVVEVIVPEAGDAVQDGITLTAEATDIDGVDAVYFYVREPNDGNGVPIGQENLAGAFNPVTGKWEYSFDTTELQDGYYVALAKAVDSYGNEGWSQIVPFSIRNWAVIKLLPATPSSKAGRTMPVKFSIRIAQSVDPAMPFVYNDDLEIRIYKSTSPSVILQRSLFGPGATDYRIDSIVEQYITNFKTLTTPATYVVEIWRPVKNFKVGSFTFKTVK